MTSTFVKSNKMKRMEFKKSHSWWWDSHISVKNSKWLHENLEEMDQNVKRMLKLIEEDADSFAKKAEMYYRRRPELINMVEDFYRMYRSLAEQYDHVTGELRRNLPSDLQSQGSGVSDGSEPPSTCPSPDLKLGRRKSGPRASGFDFFLGGGGNSSDIGSSTLDSEWESDDSSENNFAASQGNDDEQVLRARIAELEAELGLVKEKLRMEQEEMSRGSSTASENASPEILENRIAESKEELRNANEKIRLSEEEISKLKLEIQEYRSGTFATSIRMEFDIPESRLEAEMNVPEHDSAKAEIQKLQEELSVTKEKLHQSREEVECLRLELKTNVSSVQRLHEQLGSAQKENSGWKAKLDKEKREVAKLHDRISRYKSSLSDRGQEIRGLKEAISNSNKTLSEENSALQAEMTRLLKERSYLEDNLREMDLRRQSIEDEVRRVTLVKAELDDEIEWLKGVIVERDDRVEELNRSLDLLKYKYDVLVVEKDELNARVVTLHADICSKDDRINQTNENLNNLRAEHDQLVSEAEVVRERAEELKWRVEELGQLAERQRESILEGAEEKREVIRQLCFSLEHYRSGYHQLRQAFVGNRRRPTVKAS